VLDEVRDDRERVERLDLEREVVHVPTFSAGRGAASLPQLAVHRYEIDHRLAGAKLDEPELLPRALDLAAEHVAVKARHPERVGDAQYDVIETKDVDQTGPFGTHDGGRQRGKPRFPSLNLLSFTRAPELLRDVAEA
jgi:hypothetical protein